MGLKLVIGFLFFQSTEERRSETSFASQLRVEICADSSRRREKVAIKLETFIRIWNIYTNDYKQVVTRCCSVVCVCLCVRVQTFQLERVRVCETER